MRGRVPLAVLALLALLLGIPSAGVCGEMDSVSPSDIQMELDRLLVLYTEEHPDVQRLRSLLEKATKLREQKKQWLKEAQKVKASAHENVELAR